jgi:diphthamide biosynthesis protein 3
MPYEEVEIEDMEWSDELQAYTYACPCGDIFQITKVRGEEEAAVPSHRLLLFPRPPLLRTSAQ